MTSVRCDKVRKIRIEKRGREGQRDRDLNLGIE
jgi:hypothetical protein